MLRKLRRALSRRRDRRLALRRLRDLAEQDRARDERLQRVYAGHRRASVAMAWRQTDGC